MKRNLQMKIHKPYNIQRGHPHDFTVEYRILQSSEGGRELPTFQGIRWDLWYPHIDHGQNQLFMIWPEFIDKFGKVIRNTTDPVPLAGQARMWIINREMLKFHQDKIKVGMKCFAKEGLRTVANYKVLEIAGLLSNPITR